MHWIAPSGKHAASALLEKRLWELTRICAMLPLSVRHENPHPFTATPLAEPPAANDAERCRHA
jgi:hypothetical protein